MRSNLAFLREAEARRQVGPAVAVPPRASDVVEMADEHIRRFGSAGQGLVTALIFDCDGVLADTERDGHLPAFNQTFEEFGVPVRWSEEEYGGSSTIAGGKERMASLLTDDFVARAGLPTDAEGQRALIADLAPAQDRDLHGDGRRRPAAGAAGRGAGDRRRRCDAGWSLAVASTSSEPSVRAVLEHVVGAEHARAVRASWPATSCRRRSRRRTSTSSRSRASRVVSRDEALVIEDSRNGLLAAVGAGLRASSR